MTSRPDFFIIDDHINVQPYPNEQEARAATVRWFRAIVEKSGVIPIVPPGSVEAVVNRTELPDGAGLLVGGHDATAGDRGGPTEVRRGRPR